MAQGFQMIMNLFGQTFHDIIAVILLLLAVYWYVRYDLVRLDRIQQAIRRVSLALNGLDATGEDVLSRIDDLFGYEVHPAIRKPWLVYHRMASDGKRRRVPDIADVFSHEKVIVIPAARRGAESVPGILMLIGFTATLLGAVALLPDVFALLDTEATAFAFPLLANHFSIVFLSAIIGMFTGFMFQLLDRWHLQRAMASLQDFQDLLIRKLPSETPRQTGAEDFPNGPDLASFTQQFMEKINLSVSFEFQKTTEHVRHIMEHQRSADKAISLLLENLEKENHIRQETIREQSAFLEAVGGVARQSGEERQVMRDTASALGQATELLRGTMEAQVVAAEGLVEREQALRAEMRAYFETMDSQSERMLRDMSLQLDAAFSRFNDLTGLAHERLDALLRGSLDEIGGNLQSILDKLDDQVRDINLYAKALAEEVATLNGTLTDSVQSLGKQMNGGVADTFTAFDEGLADICGRFSSVMTQMRETIEELPGALQGATRVQEGK